MLHMLNDILSNDRIAKYLINKINLTKSQLDTIFIELNRKNELNLDKMTLLRDNGKVTKGSFIRTRNQAQTNIEKAIYTIIFLQYMSILEDNNISNLIKISNILKDISNNSSNVENIDEVLFKLTTVISNISGRVK